MVSHDQSQVMLHHHQHHHVCACVRIGPTSFSLYSERSKAEGGKEGGGDTAAPRWHTGWLFCCCCWLAGPSGRSVLTFSSPPRARSTWMVRACLPACLPACRWMDGWMDATSPRRPAPHHHHTGRPSLITMGRGSHQASSTTDRRQHLSVSLLA